MTDKQNKDDDTTIDPVDLGTYGEWQSLCQTWNKPGSPPSRTVSSLTESDLMNRSVVVYSLNTNREERDFALVKPVGSSTPVEGEYFWVSGANELLDA